MSNSISFVFDKFNNTDNDINMELNKTLVNELLDKSVANSYSISITKLDVPTSKIEALVFKDRNKYTITNSYYNHIDDEYQNFSSSLPNQDSHNIIYYTKESILEMINRCLANNYFQYLNATSDSNCIKTGNLENTVGEVNVNKGNYIEMTKYSDNFLVSTPYTKLAGMKVFINSMSKISGDDNQIIKFFLETPSLDRVYLYVGKITDLVKFQNYEINEFSFKDFSNVSTQDIQNFGVKSYESYTKILNTTVNGNYKLGFVSNRDFDINFDADLTLYFSDNYYIPTLPLFISRINDSLRMNVQYYYLFNNHQVGFSKTLFNSLAFTINDETRVVNSMNIVFLRYDNMLINTTDLSEIVILSQEQNSLNALSNIKEVQIRSSTLSGISENIVTDNNQTNSSNVLAEFTINKDENLGNFLLYTVSSTFWRKASVSRLSNNLKNINFSIFTTYDNNIEKQLLLAPGESFSVRLSFVQN